MHHNNDIISGKISSDIENMEWNIGTTTAQLPNVRWVKSNLTRIESFILLLHRVLFRANNSMTTLSCIAFFKPSKLQLISLLFIFVSEMLKLLHFIQFWAWVVLLPQFGKFHGIFAEIEKRSAPKSYYFPFAERFSIHNFETQFQ